MEKNKILLVDDNPKLLKLGKLIFESGGYEVITATDGLEALDLMVSHTIDLLVTDILMPNMDGYTLCSAVRSDEKSNQLPIIIYSESYISTKEKDLAIEIGADRFIRKPASMSFLVSAAKELISQTRVHKPASGNQHELSDVTKLYNSGLIEKMELKNNELETTLAELLKRERLYHALIENNADATSLKDEQGTVLYQSPATERVTGFSANEAIGKSTTDSVHAEDIPEVLKRQKISKQNPGKPIYGIHRLKHKAGHYIWVEGTMTNLLDNEHVRAMVGNFRDITGKVETQKLMDFEQGNMFALINNTNDLIWSVDRNYKLITSNSAFDEIMVHKTGKTLPKGGDVLSSGVSRERSVKYKVLYDRAFAGETFKITEFTDVPVEFWSELSFYPIRKAGEVVGTACYSHDLTERKKTEDRIAQSEADLKAIFENTSESIFLTDTHGVIKEFNDNARKTNLLNFSEPMQKGRKMIDFLPVARRDVFQSMLLKVVSGSSVQYDLSFTGLDGHYYCYDFSINPVIEEGKVKGICFNGRDITERKLSEEKIAENEQRLEVKRKQFNDLFLQAPSAICILGGDNQVFEMANPLYLQLTGKKDIIGKTAAEVFPELVDQGFLDLVKSVYRTGTPFAGNEMFIQIDRNGNGVLTDHYMNFVYQPHRNSKGEISGVFFFANLVTEQVLARKKIEQNENHFRALVENATDLIVLTDQNGKLTYASPAHAKITGCTLREIMGRSFFSFQHPDHLPELKKQFDELLANPGIPMARTSRFKRKDGTFVWVEGTVTNLLDDKNVRGIIGNFRDVTERKTAEKVIMHANRLYAFISQINQTIVHITCEKELFQEACRIATETGKFSMAWIGYIDAAQKKVSLAVGAGITTDDILLFRDAPYQIDGPQDCVERTGSYYVCNDVKSNLEAESWKPFAAKYSLNSCMVLPIKRSGIVIATLNLYSSELNLFDAQEIALLQEVAGDLSFALDVFEKEKHRRQMEMKVNHSESRLKQAQTIAHIGSWEMDLSTGEAEWSEECCRIFGLGPEECNQSYTSWLSFIHPADLEYVLGMNKESEELLSSSAYYHRIILRNGSVKYIHSQAHFELNTAGEPTGLYGVAHDITEMKNAELAMVQSEANLRLIMDIIPLPIFAKNFDGEFVFVNKSFAALYGLSPGQMVSKPVVDVIPVNNAAEEYLKHDREVISSGETKIIPELLFNDHAGNAHIFHVFKVPYTIALTNEKAVLGVITDITEQKKAEAERTKMINDIVGRNKDLEQFSYIISHNLRAPVANIIGVVGILQIPGLSNDYAQKLIGDLGGCVKRLDEVIMDLNYILQMKYTDSKKREPVKFSELMDEIEMSLAHVIKDEDAQIFSDFSAVDDMVTIKSYLYSIFHNLIANSIKYRRPEIDPVIEIHSIVTADKLVITFEDNGLGIDLSTRSEQIFGLYKRFHFHVEGKGIGLFMVKTQVESLGGRIFISSEVDKGTIFTIEFDQNIKTMLP